MSWMIHNNIVSFMKRPVGVISSLIGGKNKWLHAHLVLSPFWILIILFNYSIIDSCVIGIIVAVNLFFLVRFYSNWFRFWKHLYRIFFKVILICSFTCKSILFEEIIDGINCIILFLLRPFIWHYFITLKISKTFYPFFLVICVVIYIIL